jgi:hypothetical protein
MLVLACLVAAAQQAPARQPPVPVEVRLGDSFITLDGPWQFAPGDSPWVAGSFLWANSAFGVRLSATARATESAPILEASPI